MIELKRIVEAHGKTDFDSNQAALATVVKVEGSSYRSPGAKMFILNNGLWEGSVSGGCLEGDVLRQAQEIMKSGKARIITYDTNEDENHQLGINLGCNGIIHIYVEPINRKKPIMGVFKKLIQSQKKTILVKKLGEFPFYSWTKTDGEILDSTFDFHELAGFEKLKEKLFSQPSGMIEVNGETVFFEQFEPAIDLVIVGGGGDAQPVVQFANQLGWNVRLTDECAAHLFPKNFPNAQVIQCDRKFMGEKIRTTPYSAVVLMTHNLDYDRDALIQVLEGEAPYIGIVGPKKRWDKMVSQLEDRGIKLGENDLKRIHAPIGLDIGADTREEIALAIIAEIKSYFAQRSAKPLKERKDSIHTKDPITGEVLKSSHLI
ncbi:MAG: XdhC family protein [Bacteroidota bacterium]